jgi:GNAT superfamily N-acetyltransferase
MQIRRNEPGDRGALQAFLERRFSARVARRGELIDALAQPSLLALDGDRLAGVLTYIVGSAECEVLTLHAEQRFGGVGSALIEAVRDVAAQAGCTRLRLTTTNDNLDALRFYQRRGFRLDVLRAGAVDDCRARLKPEIPRTGDYGIPLRDELELVLDVGRPDRSE